MLVRGVVDDELGDDPQAAVARLVQKCTELAQRAVRRMYPSVIRDVVSVVFERRWIERQQPDAGDAQRGDVIEPARQARKVADPVARAVLKRTDVGLVDDRVLVPERIVRQRHGSRGYRARPLASITQMPRP